MPEESNQAKHLDADKCRVDLVPYQAVESVADVFAFGAKKYGEYNWGNGMPWRKLIGSTLRHVFAWTRGQDLDAESGLSHLAHAVCDLLMLITYQKVSLGSDDRVLTSAAASKDPK